MIYKYLMAFKKLLQIKGSDRQFLVVELSMYCCEQHFQDSLETCKTFPQWIITEFERKVDVQNHEFG